MTEKPVLWHIPVSHYSEKARWALAYKGVEHERRAPLPGAHMLYALWLTRGARKTFPVLRIDGETIGDSTEIIAALERRYPDPPLYPDDPAERQRALELEEYFDEQLGPQIRRIAWYEVSSDRDGEGMSLVAAESLPPSLRRIGVVRWAGSRFGSLYVGLRYSANSEELAMAAREKVLEALDRLEAELAGREYLVGNRFSVADLTAAALFYPLTMPPEAPQALAEMPPRLEQFVAPLRERPGARWVTEMFARHRNPGRQATSTTASTSTGTSNGS
jgi:glutathione S-transferase